MLRIYCVSQARNPVQLWVNMNPADACRLMLLYTVVLPWYIVSYIFAISILPCLSMAWVLSSELSWPSLKQNNIHGIINDELPSCIDNRQSQNQATQLPSFFHQRVLWDHVRSLCSQHHIRAFVAMTCNDGIFVLAFKHYVPDTGRHCISVSDRLFICHSHVKLHVFRLGYHFCKNNWRRGSLERKAIIQINRNKSCISSKFMDWLCRPQLIFVCVFIF